jgi:hypothetical protein
LRRVGLLLALAAAGLAGCGGSDTSGGSTPPEVVGAVTAISEDDGAIVAFRVNDGGDSYLIRIDGDRDYGFDLAHLHEHRHFADPVRVLTEQRTDGAYALEIDDA